MADPKLVDKLIVIYENKNVDYLSNIEPATFPDGLDIEIFKFKILKYANFNAKTKYDKEHVTPFIRSLNKKNKFNVLSKKDYSKLRLTLDEPEDFIVLQKIFSYFKPDIYFSWKKIVSLIHKNKKYQVNSHIERNEGVTMTKSNKLWKRAKKIIPGGNMLLSKRTELFHPKNWPAYYSKAKGIDVWDLDGKKYRDLSLMGIGCNILGYANDKIDGEVIKAIKKSNVTTLNCPEDIQLCEKLLELHPWAHMARLARTGGEASAVAVRIARAASGKDKIAFCGYHGWHDWYLSANINKKDNLQNHLMSGLEANGVPKNLKNTAFPFTYNNFSELEQIVNNNDIGTVKMEVSRNFKPKDSFLQRVRKLCTKKKIILIFDECTSGFRQTFGGLHKLYGVNPDIAWFGKALGNGYSIAAIIGKREIMDYAQNSFISSTFWTERTGPVAALETLKQMEKIKSWDIITNKGLKIQKNWKEIANRNKLEIQVLGIPALSTFSIKSREWVKYKTFITQEMLKKKYLATNALFVSTMHDDATLENYFDILDGIFNKISKFENKSLSVDKFIEGPVCQTGFQRLN